MPRGISLTKDQKDQLIKRAGEGERVRDLAKELGTSIPNAYYIVREAKKSAPQVVQVSAVHAVEAEIRQAEERIAELKEKVAEIQALEKEIELKKSFLESLKKLKEQS